MTALLFRRTCFLSASLLGGSSLISFRALSNSGPMASSGRSTFPISQYVPRSASWPYTPADFTRADSQPDDEFYTSPRYVTHIDDAAIASLRQYYATSLPRTGRILDLCSSWISHYPADIEDAATNGKLRITGAGLNQAELDRNKVLNGGRIVWDLNAQPDIPDHVLNKDAQDKMDAITCVVSIDYLTKPVEVLSSLRGRTQKDGSVHLVVSNRCFPTKAMRAWLHASEDERLQMVGDYLYFSGWRDIEIVTVSDGKVDSSQTPSAQQSLSAFLSGMVGGGRDPLWVVRAKNSAQ